MCWCCSNVLLIFFFKQKTADEMRISDWSSDVCSSDLGVLGDGRIDPGDQDAVAGDVRTGGPHLLAVHHPFVAVMFGSGLDAREVRARAGFGEQLAPDLDRKSVV